jgi:hypothetical protein
MFHVGLRTKKKKVICVNVRTVAGDSSPSKKMNEYRKPERNRKILEPIT